MGWEHLECNLQLFSCRFHSLCRLPHLHPPPEGHLKWYQRSEERALWLLLRPGVDLRPSPPHQRLLVRAPAQEAVRAVQPPRPIQLTMALVWQTENEWMALKISFFGLLPDPPKRAPVRGLTQDIPSPLWYFCLWDFIVLSCRHQSPPDQEQNKVISAQTFTGLMSYIDNVVVTPAA